MAETKAPAKSTDKPADVSKDKAEKIEKDTGAQAASVTDQVKDAANTEAEKSSGDTSSINDDLNKLWVRVNEELADSITKQQILQDLTQLQFKLQG